MSVTIYGQHAHDAIFEDDNGWARVPLNELDRLREIAWRSSDNHITRLGRAYHRDTLAAVIRDYNCGGLAHLDTCHACDDAAPFNLADARPTCPAHASQED